MSEGKIKRVAVLGLGLMGGSIGLALREHMGVTVAGCARRDVVRQQAIEVGAADEVFAEPAAAVSGADLVIICVPVSLIAETAIACVPGLSRNAVVTDVGSSKAEIVARMEAVFSDDVAHFVGSHPIAGSERQGLAAARGDLYKGATVVLTPTAATHPDALDLAQKFWLSLGADICLTSPSEHDRLLATTSHLPHLAAAILAATVGRIDPKRTGKFCGTGFGDTTRVAEGDPDIWKDIVQSNHIAITKELSAFQEQLAVITAAITAGDFDSVRAFLADAQQKRRSLLALQERQPANIIT